MFQQLRSSRVQPSRKPISTNSSRLIQLFALLQIQRTFLENLPKIFDSQRILISRSSKCFGSDCLARVAIELSTVRYRTQHFFQGDFRLDCVQVGVVNKLNQFHVWSRYEEISVSRLSLSSSPSSQLICDCKPVHQVRFALHRTWFVRRLRNRIPFAQPQYCRIPHRFPRIKAAKPTCVRATSSSGICRLKRKPASRLPPKRLARLATIPKFAVNQT